MSKKDNKKQGFDRREFIKVGVGAAAAVAMVGQASPAAAKKTLSQPGNLPTVKLPRGGQTTSVYGFGCPYLGGYIRSGANAEAKRIIRYAYDHGVTHFDSGFSYGVDGVVGDALKDVRENLFLCNKVTGGGSGLKKMVRDQTDAILKAYHTDVVDCLLVHNAFDYDNSMGVLDELDKLKKQGKVKLVGLSTHVYFEHAFKVIDTGRMDQVLLGHGYFPKGYFQMLSPRNMEFREMCIARASELKMNVTGMKVLGSIVFGRTSSIIPKSSPAERSKIGAAAIRWAYADKRFITHAIGIPTTLDIDENEVLFNGDMTLTMADKKRLAENSAAAWGSPQIKRLEEPSQFPDSPRYFEGYVKAARKRYGDS